MLKQANPPDGERGRIVLALSRAGQRTGRTLDADENGAADVRQAVRDD
ncbi:MAG: hypothetical protein JWR55_1921 [Aeromicrobium sp.]|nr:hypothetical protein [Aeromicrobium sp.]